MICPPCQTQLHEQCRYPHSCPCQHVPSEDVQIVKGQVVNARLAAACEADALTKGSGLPEPEEAKPLDMDALNRMFSAVSHIKLK